MNATFGLMIILTDLHLDLLYICSLIYSVFSLCIRRSVGVNLLLAIQRRYKNTCVKYMRVTQSLYTSAMHVSIGFRQLIR